MNNINIKSKKTRTLNKMLFKELDSKYDPLYASIYTLLASKRTKDDNKTELKLKLASLYDARLAVNHKVENNIICINYILSSIKDEYLPINISAEVESLFKSVLNTTKYNTEEVVDACNEILLFLKNYFDNKQNIANQKLEELIFPTENKISYQEMVDFYQNPNIAEIQKWISNIQNFESTSLNFNYGIDQVEASKTKLNFKYNEYQKVEDFVIDKGLNQTYLAIGYQLNGSNITLNTIANLILGGGVYSKLFKNVREKYSLSYNIRSTLVSENLIIITGGVNNEKVDQAISEINSQIDRLKALDFEEEFKLAKISYIESIKKSKSNERSYINLYINNYLKDEQRSHDSIIEEIEKIDIHQVLDIFKNLEKLAMVYVK